MSTLMTGAEAVHTITQAGNEPDWLGHWRLQAWESYEGTPLPDRVAHLWRYSEPEKFLIDKVEPLLPDGTKGRAIDPVTSACLTPSPPRRPETSPGC